jgi:hypothetical protein
LIQRQAGANHILRKQLSGVHFTAQPLGYSIHGAAIGALLKTLEATSLANSFNLRANH